MTIINQTKKENIHVCIVCKNTQGLSLPQLLDRHVLLAVFLHHLVRRTWKLVISFILNQDSVARDIRRWTLVTQTFATAISKSSWVTWTLLSLRAYIPASVQTPWQKKRILNKWPFKSQQQPLSEPILTLTSAPEAPGISSAIFLRLMPRVRFIFLEWIFKMSRRA